MHNGPTSTQAHAHHVAVQLQELYRKTKGRHTLRAFLQTRQVVKDVAAVLSQIEAGAAGCPDLETVELGLNKLLRGFWGPAEFSLALRH